MGFGGLLQRFQTGGVQNYALFILLAVVVIGVIVGAQYAFLVVAPLLVMALIAVITVAVLAVGARL
jgi:hypothetical protein